MKFLFILFFTFNSLWAATLTSTIDSIDIGSNSEPHLIMLTTGEVVFLDPDVSRQRVLDEIRESFTDQDIVAFVIDENLSLQSFYRTNKRTHSMTAPDKGYEFGPTPVTSSQALRIFRNMRRGWQNNSQCYNRAHVWSYEEFKRTGIESMKLFLFFTSRYIRNYRYKWWFHVTPMVTLKDGSWRTLDRRYSRRPLEVKTWTDDFIYSRRSCPVVSRYSEYRNHQSSEDCYLIPVSQFYWQPRDIDHFERTGYEKKSFIGSEIRHAYWEAF